MKLKLIEISDTEGYILGLFQYTGDKDPQQVIDTCLVKVDYDQEELISELEENDFERLYVEQCNI